MEKDSNKEKLSWRISGGKLPAGLTLSSQGTMTWLPVLGWDAYSRTGYILGKSKKGLKNSSRE
jgi:hypothetical protein